MADEPAAARQRAAIVEVSRMLESGGIAHWLFGGWALDYHAGRITRAHSDIDFIVWNADRDDVGALLGRAGFRLRSVDAVGSGGLYDRNDVTVELTYIAPGPDGTIVTPGYEHWPWDEDTFGPDRAALDGFPVPLASIEGLLAVKAGWSVHLDEPPRPHDVEDIALLETLLDQRGSTHEDS